MNVERIYLCALPTTYWTAQYDYVRFATDALNCERRIAKGINLEDEFNRYSVCCQRLEQEVMLSGQMQSIRTISEFDQALSSGKFPTIGISLEYLNLLHSAPQEKRLGASFFPPTLMQEHFQAFVEWVRSAQLTDRPSMGLRAEFFRAALRADCGVVEIQTAYHIPSDSERKVAPPPVPQDESSTG